MDIVRKGFYSILMLFGNKWSFIYSYFLNTMDRLKDADNTWTQHIIDIEYY